MAKYAMPSISICHPEVIWVKIKSKSYKKSWIIITFNEIKLLLPNTVLVLVGSDKECSIIETILM